MKIKSVGWSRIILQKNPTKENDSFHFKCQRCRIQCVSTLRQSISSSLLHVLQRRLSVPIYAGLSIVFGYYCVLALAFTVSPFPSYLHITLLITGAGADFVMLGGMFAGHDQCAGEIIEKNGKKVKLFYGMSSDTAMKKHAGGVAEYR